MNLPVCLARHGMIEFKGLYFQSAGAEAVSVLVQFDEVLLHVWRLSDPFYRLLSSDVFHVAPSFSKGPHAIKLPDGSRITTDDSEAIQDLVQVDKGRAERGGLSEKHIWVIGVLGFLTFATGVWWLFKTGRLF
jgi:hypothetical protein